MKKFQYLFSISLMLPACVCDAAPKPIKDAVSDIDAMFTRSAKAKVFSGSVLIAKDGEVYLSNGYGQADLEKNLACTPQTKFRLASITKQFTAMAILLLESRGALHVQDRIGDYISPCPAAWQSITIHHLLTHTSGMPDLEDFPSTVDQTMALLRDKPLDFAPGSKWQYSNCGYKLLGAVIEKIADSPYKAFLRDNIFIPLQMTNTGYDHGEQDLATSYETFGRKADMYLLPHCFSAGALYSTVEDLYRWDQALSTDTLIPKPYFEKLFTPYAPFLDDGGNHFSYGYGWILGSIPGRPSQFHMGVCTRLSTLACKFRTRPIRHISVNLSDTENEFFETQTDIVQAAMFVQFLAQPF